MDKPTKDQVLQALDDLGEGRCISADMRVAVNQYLRGKVEAHLDQEANAETVRHLAAQRSYEAMIEDCKFLRNKSLTETLTPYELERLDQIRLFWTGPDEIQKAG